MSICLKNKHLEGGQQNWGMEAMYNARTGKSDCLLVDAVFFFVLNNGVASNRGRSSVGLRTPTKETVLGTSFYVILLISLSDVVKTGVFPWPVCCRKISQFVVQCYC